MLNMPIRSEEVTRIEVDSMLQRWGVVKEMYFDMWSNTSVQNGKVRVILELKDGVDLKVNWKTKKSMSEGIVVNEQRMAEKGVAAARVEPTPSPSVKFCMPTIEEVGLGEEEDMEDMVVPKRVSFAE